MTTAMALVLGMSIMAAAWAWRARGRRPSASTAGVDLRRMVDALPRRAELRATLDALAASLSAECDDAPVVLRLFNERSGLYEARGFAGLSDRQVTLVSNADVSRQQFEQWSRTAAADAAGYHLEPGPAAGDEGDLAVCGPKHPSLWILPLPAAKEVPLGYFALGLGAHRDPAQRASLLKDLVSLSLPLALLVERSLLHVEVRARKRECALAAEELGDLQRLKDNFVATVSHELRTPLTSIRAYAEILAERPESLSKPQACEFSKVILRESDRLEEAFDTILDVAQPDACIRWRHECFDLREVCGRLHRVLSAAYQDKGVELVLDPPARSLDVHGDRTAVMQVVRNLLDNALKFTGAGGAVHLRLDEHEGQARLVVEDTGIGIPPGERERIFERFYQIDGSSTRLHGGQGLGLAICRQIIEGHAGRIWAERASGGGARFVVLLPERGLILHPHHEIESDAEERLLRTRFFQLVTSLVAETLRTRIVSIMRPDEGGQGLRIDAALGLAPDVVRDTHVRAGEAVAGWVWSEGRPVLATDLDADPRFHGRGNEVQYPTRSLLSCPLRCEGKVLGVVNVNNKVGGTPFDEEDQLTLEAVAERLSKALVHFDAHQRNYRRLRRSEAALRAMLAVSRQRATELRRTVAACGTETGRRLGLADEDLRTLTYALGHYDVGMAEVSPDILAKSRPLRPAERDEIRDHVRRGVELITELEPSPLASKILLHHHEDFDGTGYPHGSQGEAIPIGARIVRLVDTFCALVEDRPHRGAIDPSAALDVLRGGIGRQFCPRVAPLFLSVLTDRWERIEAAWERVTRSGPRADLEPIEAPVPVGAEEDR